MSKHGAKWTSHEEHSGATGIPTIAMWPMLLQTPMASSAALWWTAGDREVPFIAPNVLLCSTEPTHQELMFLRMSMHLNYYLFLCHDPYRFLLGTTILHMLGFFFIPFFF
jgi:hypothetical protein